MTVDTFDEKLRAKTRLTPLVAASVHNRPSWPISRNHQWSSPLLDEIQRRPSNVMVDTTGDYVTLGEAEHAVRFALREPARAEGEWWNAQARHDGDVAVVFVHPARHECFSGITWLIAAYSGEILACGADTAASRWVSSDAEFDTPLAMPEADSFPGHLSCAFPLDPDIIRQGPPQ